MLKLAIVGPEENKWSSEQKNFAQKKIYDLFYNYSELSKISLVSGHCPKGGVDIWAEVIANILSLEKQIFPAQINRWNDYIIYGNNDKQKLIGFKTRNIKIAETCDILYCIVPEAKENYCNKCKIYGHPSNGGCWTLNYTKKLKKETHLVVIK